MNTKTIISFSLLLLACTTLAQSAPRYIELVETNFIDNTLTLLGRPEVRADLAMESNQVGQFRALLNTRPDERTTLDNLLTPKQQQRLHQLLLQTKGPVFIALDSATQEQLGLTPEQKESVAQSLQHYEQFRLPFVQRYGRQLVAGITDQTVEERKAEVDALALAITHILKERDQDILHALTEEQRRIFVGLEGTPLEIAWPQHEMVFGETFKE